MSLGYLAMGAGDYSRAVLWLERSLEIWRRLGHKHHASQTLRFLGQATRGQGDLERASSYFKETVEVYREQGHRAHLAIALHEFGNVLYEQRDYERAALVYSESLDLLTQVNSSWGLDCARNNLGSTLFHLGDIVRAKTLHREALALYRQTQSMEGIAWSLERLAVVEAADGDARKAVRLFGAASVVRESLGKPLDRWDQEDWERAIASMRSALDEAIFTILWAEGRTLTMDEAVAYALTHDGED
jgi:tetratricopeptide (TPR) repeat protein